MSDGQRALLVLYSVLIYAEKSKDFILCIDEPGNYISLPEIQPWLSRLSMECEEGGVQALITTHHPEIIDYLGISSAIFLSRNVNGPIRTERIEEAKDSFPLSELIARRWIG